jgi:hypothetical protein
LLRSSNSKCFIYNKTKHLTKDFRNRAQQGNPKKVRNTQANIIEVDHLTNKILIMNLFVVVFVSETN